MPRLTVTLQEDFESLLRLYGKELVVRQRSYHRGNDKGYELFEFIGKDNTMYSYCRPFDLLDKEFMHLDLEFESPDLKAQASGVFGLIPVSSLNKLLGNTEPESPDPEKPQPKPLRFLTEKSEAKLEEYLKKCKPVIKIPKKMKVVHGSYL